MAAKKKAKSKTKRRTTAAKRPAIRKKPVKVTKKPARKAPPARRLAPKAKAPKTRAPQAAPPPPPPPGERIGVVTHYFSHLAVAVIKLESATLHVGDAIHIRGHTTDFSQRVESLQVDHAAVDEVGPNDDFGLKVNQHVRENDIVYKVK
jgi:hypothetical protein